MLDDDDDVGPALGVTVEEVEIGAAALVQPPKSSSSVIFGAALAGLRDDDDGAPPHDEKSIVVAMDGALLTAGFVVDVALTVGSELAQASLEPQGSALERLENAFNWEMDEVVACGRAGVVETGLDRLKAEFKLEEAVVEVAFGAVACGVGSAKSKRL